MFVATKQEMVLEA